MVNSHFNSVAAVLAYVFGNQTPNKRPFSLADRDISFPFVTNEKISTPVLFAVALAIPAVVIFLIAAILIPGPTVPKSVPKSLIFKRKLWEWYTGWTGLALSCATAWVITNGMKVSPQLSRLMNTSSPLKEPLRPLPSRSLSSLQP